MRVPHILGDITMDYIFDSNLDVWNCVKKVSATDYCSALREFEKELQHMEDEEALEFAMMKLSLLWLAIQEDLSRN